MPRKAGRKVNFKKNFLTGIKYTLTGVVLEIQIPFFFLNKEMVNSSLPAFYFAE